MAERIPDDFYRIGSVAALTGIAVERLRAGNDATASVQRTKRANSLLQCRSTGKAEKNQTSDRPRPDGFQRDKSERKPIYQRLTDQNALTLNTAPPTKEAFSPKVGLVGANLQLEQQQDRDGHLNIVARWQT